MNVRICCVENKNDLSFFLSFFLSYIYLDKILAPLGVCASSKEKEDERCQQFGLHCSNATLATELCTKLACLHYIKMFPNVSRVGGWGLFTQDVAIKEIARRSISNYHFKFPNSGLPRF
jgi:hypothetical protein